MDEESSMDISTNIDLYDTETHIQVQDELQAHEAVLSKTVKEIKKLAMEASELEVASGTLYAHEIKPKLQHFKSRLEEDETLIKTVMTDNENQAKQFKEFQKHIQLLFQMDETADDTILDNSQNGEPNHDAERAECVTVLDGDIHEE